MNKMRSPRSLLRRFIRAEDGTLIAETLMVLPFMCWAYMAMFVYWDAYRSVNNVQRATYSIADMLSREMRTIDAPYITGLRNLMEYMIDSDQDSKMRVTSIAWSGINNRFEVLWSNSPSGAMPALTTATLANFADCANMASAPQRCRIPAMMDGDTAIIVETEVQFFAAFAVPFYNITTANQIIDDGRQTIKQFVVTRPRFVPRICFNGIVCSS
jgi:hypothetical protein